MLVVKRSTPTDDYNIKAVNFFLKKYEFYVIILEEKLLSKKHLSSWIIIYFLRFVKKYHFNIF